VSASLLAGPRLPFAMAEQHQLPEVLAATHRRFHTPHACILLHGLLGLVLALSSSFTYVLSIAAISKLLTAVATCAALPVLRARSGDHSAAFRAPAGLVASRELRWRPARGWWPAVRPATCGTWGSWWESASWSKLWAPYVSEETHRRRESRPRW
jgi:amino acid transporter